MAAGMGWRTRAGKARPFHCPEQIRLANPLSPWVGNHSMENSLRRARAS